MEDNSIYGTNDVSARCCKKTLTTIMNGNNDLFVVSGGPIRIREIIGIVVTQIQAKSCTVNYNADPTSPATDTAFGATAPGVDINGAAVGSLLTYNGTVATDLTLTPNGVNVGQLYASSLIMPPGSIEFAAVVSTSATGAIDFYIRYEPLIAGAIVTPA